MSLAEIYEQLPDIQDFQRIERPAWMRWAACRGKPTEWFFPLRTEEVRKAKALCAKCPVPASAESTGRRTTWWASGAAPTSLSDRGSDALNVQTEHGPPATRLDRFSRIGHEKHGQSVMRSEQKWR